MNDGSDESTVEPGRRISSIGLVVTAIYLLVVLVYVVCEWKEMLALTPNEFGDFLAGAFGPLALAWLVFGYFQQGIELRQNTRALNLQAEELKKSTLALELQVNEMKQSVKQQTRLAQLAADQLEMQAREVNRQEQERSRQVEPRFEVTKDDRYHDGAPAVGVLTVINSGARVTVTRIEVAFEDDEHPTMSDWSTGNVHAFVPWREGRPADVPVEFRIRYRQADGMSRALLISIPQLSEGIFGPAELSVVE